MIRNQLDGYLHENLKLITGTATGADAIAIEWAKENDIEFFAERLEKGPYPYPMHAYNKRMLEMKPDIILAFKHNLDLENQGWRGTEHMVLLALAADIPVCINGS